MYACKHVDLFKQIPFEKFYYGKDLFDEVIALQNKNVEADLLLKCYYQISKEIYDPINLQFIVRQCLQSYDFHDNINQSHYSIYQHRFKRPKLFNGVLGKCGYNRHPHRPHGLIIRPKQGIPKKEIYNLIENFSVFTALYQPRQDPLTKEIEEVPAEKIDHLYMLLKELLDKANFSYVTKGSVVLAREMSEALTHQSIIIYTKNMIRCGQNHDIMMQWLKQHKQLMFNEIKHTYQKHH